MLNLLFIVCCLVLLTYLSHHWWGLTAQLQSESQHKRLTDHLNWKPKAEPEGKGKVKGRTKRR